MISFFFRLIASMVTLMWGALNMVNLKSLEGLDDGTYIHAFSYFLFTFYYCATMIVLVNMLIAMMSNSYQYIQVSYVVGIFWYFLVFFGIF